MSRGERRIGVDDNPDFSPGFVKSVEVSHEICQATVAARDKTGIMEINRVLPDCVGGNSYYDVENARHR